MRLLLARVGKTTAVQERLLDLKRQKPLAKVWVLLSTERQIVDFRQRFVQNGRVFFNVETFNFYSLYHHLLAIAGNPQRCLDDTARFGLIRALLTDLYGDREGVFGGIALTPGFIQIIATFIYELKQNLIAPEDFRRAAVTSKELELAHIYIEYQLLLRRYDLVDREGEGWLALEGLQRSPEIGRAVDLLIVDGYDQFNRLQAELLTVLGSQTRDAIITLATIPGRENTIGRRFEDAFERLIAAHETHGLALEIQRLVAHDERHLTLQHLSEQLLRPQPQRVPSSEAIRWIEAPDPAHEVGAVLRSVKRLLLGGCSPDDILIAVRDWPLYGSQLAAQGRVYDLPLALHYGDPLASNPAVVALLDLLSLGDFRRRDLLDTLRSPYFAVPGLDSAQVDLLDQISRALLVTSGRTAWLEAITLASTRGDSAAEDDDYEGTSLLLDSRLAAELKTSLKTFFDSVTPPLEGTVDQYVAWLEALIGQDVPDPDEEIADIIPAYCLNMPAQIRADQATTSRDLAAMQGFKRVLRGLLSAQTLAGSLGYAHQTDWQTFFRDLKATVENTVIERGAARDGRVLVSTVTDARGLSHSHVFILGLSESIFPQPIPEDPLLLDTERERFRQGGVALPTQAERAGDDGLFFSLIGQARDSLTLSRPHSKNGELWTASHLWRAVLAVFSDAKVEHLRLGDVPVDPATRYEAALVAAERLSAGQTPGWVDPVYWERIRRGRRVEMSRLARDPHDHYSGRLQDGNLIAWAAKSLDSSHVWSASQLNDYGMCGFRFFTGRLLRLEPLEEPEEGMDSRQLGTLYHEILEQTYHRLGGAITLDRLDEALRTLDKVADERMASAPERLRFRASARWPQEQSVLRRKLERLIRDDFGEKNPLNKAFGAQPRTIYRQEARFGGDEVSLDLGDERLRVRGTIDRIDQQGERVIVIDYKTGSTLIPVGEVERGRNFQMMVYLQAAEALIAQDQQPDAPSEVAGGVFWRIGGDSLGAVTSEDTEMIEAGKVHLKRYLEQARAGDFAAHANKLDGGRCAHYCDFHQFCRVNNVHQRKT